MSRIRGKDTQPERLLRSRLHRLGYRFRLHRRDLPGKPDIVLPKYRTAVLVHGCFWHSHECQRGRLPKSNVAYWHKKLARNKLRDEAHLQELQELNWEAVVVWECEIRSDPDSVTRRVVKSLEERPL